MMDHDERRSGHRRWAGAVVGALVLVLSSVTVGPARAAEPPMRATLVGPADGGTTASIVPTLQVAASDPDGGTVSVRFEGRPSGATVPGAGGGPFSLVVLPDTQNYTYSNRQGIITQQAEWIVANRAALNTAFVAQIGDLVSNYDNVPQWVNVSAGLKPLDDAGVPTSVIPGNHDFDTATGAVGLYDTYFPVSRYAGAPWTPSTATYGGYLGQNQFGPDPVDRRNMDNYALVSAGGTDFLMLNLEWEAPADVLDWADRVLDHHPDRTVILTTHSYVSITGGLRTIAQRTGGTAPAALWSSFVSTHCQIKLVLSGHEHSGDLGEARRTDTNACGQPVHGILTDYQSRPNGGDGWLRYYTFDPAAGSMTASTYSPRLARYETDADSAFSLPFPFATGNPAPFSPIGTVQVASGGIAETSWSGLADDTAYEWRAVVDDGTSSTVSDTWTLRTPPRAQVLGDEFRRSLTGGWGSADTGQRWATSVPSASAVDGDRGTLTVPPGTTRTAKPTDVLLTDGTVEADLRFITAPSGSGTYVSLLGRDAGSQSYRAKLTFRAGGSTTLAITRNSAGTDTALASLTLPGSVLAGTTLRVRFQQSGTAPTTLRASAWPAAGAEPAGWMLSATDVTAALQSAGGVGLDAYVSSSATAIQTVQVDRFTVVRPGTSTPPANVAPIARIATPVVVGRTVRLDGSGSTDADGSVTAWRWSFGDGGSADGVTIERTYAADGTYPVTLTVTDDDGATASVSISVTVSAPPPVTELARDAFARSVANGWGPADAGGTWSVTGTAGRYAVSGGSARQSLSVVGTTAEAVLAGVSAVASETRVTVSWSRSASAGKLYTSVVGRSVSSSSDYRLAVTVAGDGRPTLTLVRRVGGVETRLTSVSPALTVTAGAQFRLAVRLTPVAGGTEFAAKMWPAGATEPAAWAVTATDATAALQTAGSIKLASYLSSSATAPVETAFDDLLVTRL